MNIKRKKNKLNKKYIIIPCILLILLIFSGYYFTNAIIINYKIAASTTNYVAHALGGIDNNSYTNSKEALENSYASGFRFFEVDLNFTSDNKLVLVHGWNKNDYVKHLGLEYNEKNPIMDYETFMNIKIKGKYTPISFKHLVEFMINHKDMYVMIDIGSKSEKETKKIYTKIVEDANYDAKVLQRLIVDGHTTKMIETIKKIYDFKLINLYWADNKDREKKIYNKEAFVKYCKDNSITSLSISTTNYTKELGYYMKKYGLIVYVFTINNQKKSETILKNADLVGTDFLKIVN